MHLYWLDLRWKGGAKMNERLMEFLWKSEVSRLSAEKKRLYQFIVEKEDNLAEGAVTVEDFYERLMTQSPVELAVAHFKLPYNKIVKSLMEIEMELAHKISVRSNNVKWIDFTNHTIEINRTDKKKLLFLFVN